MVRPAGLLSNRYPIEDMPDLTGKVAIVVGGSRGVGEAAVHALVQKNCKGESGLYGVLSASARSCFIAFQETGARVHIISATEEHAEAAISHASELTSSAPSLIDTHTVDLGDLRAVQTLIEKLAKDLDRLDFLLLIAGIGVSPSGLTKDGLGSHFGVNNVSQLLIADILYPVLAKTASKSDVPAGAVRIVTESSELHRSAPSDVKAESLEEMAEDVGPTKMYGRSKLGNIWFAAHLSTLLPPVPPILAISVHPGAVATEQQQSATEAYPILGKVLETVAPAVFMTKEQGAESALWAATSPELNGSEKRAEVQGRYFNEAYGKPGSESTQAQDPAMAARFWALMVKALKEKAGYDVKLGTAQLKA